MVRVGPHKDKTRVGESTRTDYVSREFAKWLGRLHINGRYGLGFYSLRHVFATIGLHTTDRDAVRAIMGHVEGDVLAAYDETGPNDDRLRAVVEHVRQWLFGAEEAT
jgi:integrase